MTATTNRREALTGARYIINCVRVGGLEAYAGVSVRSRLDRASVTRSAPAAFSTASATSPSSSTSARISAKSPSRKRQVLNYANPMAMNTWAAIEYGKVDTVGLCHGVQHGAEQIAEVLGREVGFELDYICSGINHQTWFVDLKLNGRKIGKDELIAAFEAHRCSRSRKSCVSTC